MYAQTIPQNRVRRAGRILGFALLLLALLSPEAAAQKPWVGWYGPLSDGIMGFRFGMDRADVRAEAQRRNVTAVHARSNTMRYTGSFLSTEGELLFEFRPDEARPGRELLIQIRIDWVGIEGGGGRPKSMFDSLTKLLEERYGPAVYRRDAEVYDISSGFRDALHIYEGTEMQAQLSLSSASKQSLRLMLLLISPQLDQRMGP